MCTQAVRVTVRLAWYGDHMKVRSYIWISLMVGMVSLPLITNAHAMPVSYVPQSAAVVDILPASLSVTFSERIDIRRVLWSCEAQRVQRLH